MGNMHCPAEDAAHLALVARDICPFPNYNPNPFYLSMLSINSSLHLRKHYMAVQSSLTPKQLEDFTQGLRTTFGREGKVTLGGVGVVALSLAVLFDTLAKQARGESVSETDPILGWFVKDPRGFYLPYVYTVSKYLRLVPHIANNPDRMREETERYIKQLVTDGGSLEKLGQNHTLPLNEDVTAINGMLGHFFSNSLLLHLLRIRNITADNFDTFKEQSTPDTIFNLNCDLERADKEFLSQVQKSDNRTQEAWERCKPTSWATSKSPVHHVAKLVWLDAMFSPLFVIGNNTTESMAAQREDFDLKANALGIWSDQFTG